MVMHARKPPRFSDGCSDRRDSQSYQAYKYPLKSHPATDQRHDKSRDASDSTPPCKMLRRSDSPDGKPTDVMPLNKSKAAHAQRLRERDGGTSNSPQENTLSHSSHHGANSHSLPSKASDMSHEPADDWSEHISSSGKKYYYNCRTEVSQWEKPKDWVEREQRQKEGSKSTPAAVNTFPKDRDYRREAMQAPAINAFPNTKSSAAVDTSSYPASSSSQSSSSSSSTSASSSAAQGLNPSLALSSSTSTFTSSSSSSSSSVPSSSSSSSAVPASSSSSSSSSSSAPQSSSAALLQDPALLRQLLPALQATLHLNHANVDVGKLNEVLTAAVTQASLQSMLHKLLTSGPSAFNITSLLSQAAQLSTQAQTTQSPHSLPSDASSPRSYVSSRVSTPQTNAVSLKPPLSASGLSSQPKVNALLVKPGSAAPHGFTPAEKALELEDPRLHRQNSQGSTSPGSNHVAGAAGSGSAATGTIPINTAPGRAQTGFTPSLVTHFNEGLIRHVQGWPSEHVEKQIGRLREEGHTMGNLYMSDICTEMKKLRSLVRVCEIQATLREQRILFLRQQIKELDKMKNQNSYMI